MYKVLTKPKIFACGAQETKEGEKESIGIDFAGENECMCPKKRRRPPPEAKILGGVFEGGIEGGNRLTQRPIFAEQKQQ